MGVPLTMTTRSFSLKMGREIKKEREDLREVFMKTAEHFFFLIEETDGFNSV